MAEPIVSATLVETVADFERAPSLRALQNKIERLPVSADAKSLLMDVAAITLVIGGKVLAFGRKLLALVFDLANKFQNVLFGVLVALVLSVVLASVPLLGPIISALLTPIMLAFGILAGSLKDFSNMSVQRDLVMLKQRLDILATYA